MNHPPIIALGLVIGFVLPTLVGCEQAQKQTVVIESSTGRVIEEATYGEEICYKGVVYVRFNSSSDTRSSWGGAKYLPNGTVALCKSVNRNGQ